MYKGTAESHQFQTRSGSDATKGSAKGYSILGGGEDPNSVLSLNEKRESLKARFQQIHEQIHACKAAGQSTRHLHDELLSLTAEIKAIRGRIRSIDASTIPHIFMSLCRQHMTKLEFKRYLDMANECQRNGVSATDLRLKMESGEG